MEHKINIPPTVNAMSLKHLPFLEWLVELNENERSVLDLTPVELHECLALFTGIPKQQFGMYLLKSNYKLLEQILLAFNKREEVQIPYEVVYDDQVFVFNKTLLSSLLGGISIQAKQT